MKNNVFQDGPPLGDEVTSYDKTHLITYLRLLDAAADEANWHDVVKIVFDLDPVSDPERAQRIHDSHLARARWMTEHGYRHLLDEKK